MTVRSALRAPVRAAVRAPIILRNRWTPASLFAQGQQGVWYEPKPQYLYQDAAGTVPVTADGDPVGYMQDLSGNGNHATQPTSARRPVFPGLEYDGVGDFLSSLPSNLVEAPFTMAVKFKPSAVDGTDLGKYRIVSRGDGASTRGAVSLDDGRVRIHLDGADGLNTAIVGVGDEVVVICRFLTTGTIVLVNGEGFDSSSFIAQSVDSTPIRLGSQTQTIIDASLRVFEGKIASVVIVNSDVGESGASLLSDYLAGITL